MENIYDIRNKKNLYYILDEHTASHHISPKTKAETAIVAYIYYQDSADKFMKYLKEVPEEIAVYIISSNEEVRQIYDTFIKNRKNVSFIKKENRGRDISALLVEGRKIWGRYTYLCFVHDKKEKVELMSEDTQLWVENMWGNSIKSAAYIENIIGVFEKNDNIGLLAIPEPMGTYINACYNNTWGKNFANTKALAEKLELECDIDSKKPPITLGTVFWCRTVALRKLFEVEWTYEDFPEEPLATDGTISHAVERVLAYVAQDCGYETGTVMTSSYAAKYLAFLQSGFQQAFIRLRGITGIGSRGELGSFEENKKRIVAFFQNNKTVYLYGAGARGKDCAVFCKHIGCIPKGIIVTDKIQKEMLLEGIQVIPMAEVKDLNTAGIIIAVSYNLQKTIIGELRKRNITNYICFTGACEYCKIECKNTVEKNE